LVFQSTKKSIKSTAIGADFQDLELVKTAEKKSIQSIEVANKKAEKLIANAEQEIKSYLQKSLENLKSKLDSEFLAAEKQAKAQAKKIKAEGEKEANILKEQTKGKVPKAIEYIVGAVINE
jgi:vacuolar-type H+-ATPase subunit H